MYFLRSPWLGIITKPVMSIFLACVILLVYMGFLLTTNYKNQVALHLSYLKTFKLDMGKRGASIEYFFSERKYDLRYLTSSHEISNYFMNRTLGMSEDYGLRLNVFLIKKLLQGTILKKLIHGREIYERFIMIDNNGYSLADTSEKQISRHHFFHRKFLSLDEKEPEIIIGKIGGKPEIIMVAPCFYRNKSVGELVAVLNMSSFVINFIDFFNNFSFKGFEFITKDGKYLFGDTGKDSGQAYKCISMFYGKEHLTGNWSYGALYVHEYPDILVAVQPIGNAPLDLVGWIKKDLVFGSVAPWKLFIVTGIIAVIILISVGIIIRISIQNLVLQTRFDETAKQHKLMREKNRQLEYEMAKRYQAEQELEKQRTLRIRSDRLRSLGEMAAGIAHELNQPLMGVKGMSELILLSMNRTDQVSYGRIKKNAEIIMEQADRMVHIIQHVRLFAREAGNIEKSIEDINEVVRSGIGLVQEQFKYHGIVLKMKLSPRSIFVFINPFSLEEVILNLSGNAKDAVEDKKKLNPEAEYVPTITISTWQTIGKNSKAYLEIRDNGMGISDDIKSKIFDPFFTTKAPDKGTGLGLSITRSIVKEFNGEIILESNEGEGCVFTIIFPVYVMEETYKGSRDV